MSLFGIRTNRLWLLLAACLLAATSLMAQQGWRRGGEGRYTEPLRRGLPEQRHGFTFCRLWYDSGWRFPSGYGWSTDYPRADRNFMIRLPQITNTRMSYWSDGTLGHTAVRATDPDRFSCPFMFASDIGSARFTGAEVEGLREYLLRGGFLWVDDFWGEEAWGLWADQIGRVLPEYDIVDLPMDHPLFSAYYALRQIPQIPSIQSWTDTRGATQERGFEPGDPHMRAILDEHGRILVLMTHNTDIADGWEREQDNEDFFFAFTAAAYGVGINVALHVMSH